MTGKSSRIPQIPGMVESGDVNLKGYQPVEKRSEQRINRGQQKVLSQIYSGKTSPQVLVVKR